MAGESTGDRTRKLLAELLGTSAEEMQDHTSLEQLGADSLDLIELEMAAEETFGIDFPPSDGSVFGLHTTIAEAVAIVDQKLAA